MTQSMTPVSHSQEPQSRLLMPRSLDCWCHKVSVMSQCLIRWCHDMLRDISLKKYFVPVTDATKSRSLTWQSHPQESHKLSLTKATKSHSPKPRSRTKCLAQKVQFTDATMSRWLLPQHSMTSPNVWRDFQKRIHDADCIATNSWQGLSWACCLPLVLKVALASSALHNVTWYVTITRSRPN